MFINLGRCGATRITGATKGGAEAGTGSVVGGVMAGGTLVGVD